ncbi:MAG TPA: hypothetical protein VJH92_01745 [Candidatus Nanoarchaeia archaeon]|nr:hypothetical protein [Candidatus Nanoarchaeia archaeon]
MSKKIQEGYDRREENSDGLADLDRYLYLAHVGVYLMAKFFSKYGYEEIPQFKYK